MLKTSAFRGTTLVVIVANLNLLRLRRRWAIRKVRSAHMDRRAIITPPRLSLFVAYLTISACAMEKHWKTASSPSNLLHKNICLRIILRGSALLLLIGNIRLCSTSKKLPPYPRKKRTSHLREVASSMCKKLF